MSKPEKKPTPEQRREIERDALYQIRTQCYLGDLDTPIGVHLCERTPEADIVQLASARPPQGNTRGAIRYYAVDRDEIATASRVFIHKPHADLAARTATLNTDQPHTVRQLGSFYRPVLEAPADVA
jgi:hypothetical protein